MKQVTCLAWLPIHSKCSANVSSCSFKMSQALAVKEMLRGQQVCPPTMSDVPRVPLSVGAMQRFETRLPECSSHRTTRVEEQSWFAF